jgi:hypothetical protein
MYRSLPRYGRLVRLLALGDAVGGALAYGCWRWLQQHQAATLAVPASRLWVEIGLVAGGALVAAALTRWAVYRGSSWEPSFFVALGAVVTTPLLGAALMRAIAVAEHGERPAPAAAYLPHRTTTSRMGATKRLSEL